MAEQPKPKEESSEERLQWLRDHGVEVETPQERAAAKEAVAAARLLTEGDPGTRTYKYVKIPAGMVDPLEELTAVVYEDQRGLGDSLMPILGGHFTEGQVDTESLKQASIHNLTEGLGQTALKRLPINPRAADFASRCGYGDGVAFHGDIYIGRKNAGSGWEANVDFTLEETKPNAEWISKAYGENMARQAAEGRTGGMSAEEISTRGGDGDGYTWTQDAEEVTITVRAPAGTKGKNCTVKFKVSELSCKVEGGLDLSVKLFAKVAPDGCSWSITDGDLVLTLEKGEEGETWPSLVRD